MMPARSSMRIASTSCCFIASASCTSVPLWSDPPLPELPRAADRREVDGVRQAAFLGIERGDRSAERRRLQLDARADLGEDARNTATGRLGPTATKPCARSRTTALSPSTSASAAPRSALADDDVGRAELVADVEDRHAGGEKRGVVIRRDASASPRGRTERPTANGRVRWRHDVRSRAVDLAVEKALDERTRGRGRRRLRSRA